MEATYQGVFKEMKESFYLVHPFVFVILNSGKIVLTISLFLPLPCAESGPAKLVGTGLHGVTHERRLNAKTEVTAGCLQQWPYSRVLDNRS